MADQSVVEPKATEIYKTDDMKLIAFLLGLDCKIKEGKLRDDNRVDFFISGQDVSRKVADWDSIESPQAKWAHKIFNGLDHARDMATRLKKENSVNKK